MSIEAFSSMSLVEFFLNSTDKLFPRCFFSSAEPSYNIMPMFTFTFSLISSVGRFLFPFVDVGLKWLARSCCFFARYSLNVTGVVFTFVFSDEPATPAVVGAATFAPHFGQKLYFSATEHPQEKQNIAKYQEE